MKLNRKLELSKESVLDFCAYQALQNQRVCKNNIFNCDRAKLFEEIANSISSPFIAAQALDELKHKCSKEQKMFLLQKVLTSDELEYIIENTRFDKYIIKEMIKSNLSTEVLYAIVKRYIHNESDFKYYTSKCNKKILESIMILTKLE